MVAALAAQHVDALIGRVTGFCTREEELLTCGAEKLPFLWALANKC